jgi:hypothetical protein
VSPARLTNLGKALARLDGALALAESDVTRDAAIQRFELTWKVVREGLVNQGLSCTWPGSCLREAFKQGLGSPQPFVLTLATCQLQTPSRAEPAKKVPSPRERCRKSPLAPFLTPAGGRGIR